MKFFSAVDKLASIVTGRVPVNAVTAGGYHERGLWYGNHHRLTEHLPAAWMNIGEGERRQNHLLILIPATHQIMDVRASPLAAVVTHKVRIFNHLSFDGQSTENKGVLNRDRPGYRTQCLCTLALPKFVAKIVTLRK